MKQKDLYKIRTEICPNFNYYFDKITSFFIKSKKKKIKNPKKILIIRNDHIGDMAYSTHIFRILKNYFPKTKIGVIATADNRQLIEKDPYIDKIFEIDLFWRRKFRGFLDYLKIIKKIRKEKFDVGIDLRQSKLNIFFFLWVPKIKSRISFYNVNGGKAFLTHPICYDKKISFTQEMIKLVADAFNLKVKNCLPHIITDKEDKKEVGKLIKEKKLKKYVIFAPGATEEAKKWPEKKFDELINRFHKKYPGYKVVLSGANNDKDLIQRLCVGKNFCVPLINFNLRLMSILFRRAGAIVANDGAGTAVSWISGGKLVSLAGPVDLELSRALKNSKIIHHKLDCYPCFWTQPCKKPCGIWCMELITVEEVMKAIDDFMRK